MSLIHTKMVSILATWIWIYILCFIRIWFLYNVQSHIKDLIPRYPSQIHKRELNPNTPQMQQTWDKLHEALSLFNLLIYGTKIPLWPFQYFIMFKLPRNMHKATWSFLTSLYSGIKFCKQHWATWLPFMSFIKVTIPGLREETIMENCSEVLRVSITFWTARVLHLGIKVHKITKHITRIKWPKMSQRVYVKRLHVKIETKPVHVAWNPNQVSSSSSDCMKYLHLLIFSTHFKQLLNKIISKRICHELNNVINNLQKNLLHILRRTICEFSL